MKTLVVYYSYSGKTKMVAEEVAKKVSGDIRIIEYLRRPSHMLALFWECFKASRGKSSLIKNMEYSLNPYQRIFIGTPIWAWNAAPPVNAFVEQCDFTGKQVVLFSTAGSSGGKAVERLSERIKQKGGIVVDSFSIKTGGKKNEEITKEAQSGSSSNLDKLDRTWYNFNNNYNDVIEQ